MLLDKTDYSEQEKRVVLAEVLKVTEPHKGLSPSSDLMHLLKE